MSSALVKTSTPGIYRRHTAKCSRRGTCKCAYVVAWTYEGTQHRRSFARMTLAKEYKRQVEDGERQPASKQTFGAYFADWIESYSGRTSRGFAETTRSEYRRSIEDLALPAWRSKPLGEIRPTHVAALFAKLRREGVNTSAMKKVRAPLSALFATAVERGLVRSNPMTGIRVPAALKAERPPREQTMTKAELNLFLGAVDSDWVLFFTFLTETGLRIGEALGLTWENLDLGKSPRVLVRQQFYEGNLTTRLKTKSSRRDVPLGSGLCADLIAHRRDHLHVGPDKPVFATAAGTFYSAANIYSRHLRPAAFAVGLVEDVLDDEGKPVVDKKGKVKIKSSISFHSFRHLCGSMLFEGGQNAVQVAKWLGHSKTTTTMNTYVHLLDDGLGDANFFDDLIRPVPLEPARA